MVVSSSILRAGVERNLATPAFRLSPLGRHI
jgi:hypothetical protein